MEWDLPQPFVIEIVVAPSAIDEYEHANNAEYLRWIEQVSWAHSESLGLSLARYRELDRGMAVHRHELDYLAPAFEGDRLRLATWIIDLEGRLTLTRRFQLLRPADGRTLLRARTRFACIELSSGRPRRLPDEYRRIYGEAAVADTP
ncbi:acyl-CoA thioesterase [Halomonas lysinitropha]|uniref:Long-chain acyl-CoA thioesterase FadM n=1 Tax=Halomonas lysinitropha TaxID=2607506 RepID=A0A5K1I6I3_9GAMM|nr:thioesterase family protein [Halomonas lysinitropha]VVZ95817.1 Long-chain acyl-CoA thioesterase FadM [Halomonas lysinitropha]